MDSPASSELQVVKRMDESMYQIDDTDRRIINGLQGGFPIGDRPYAVAARELGITEQELIERLGRMLDAGILSRFGPMMDADRMEGAITLAAMRVPSPDLEQVAAQVNRHREVAHNYERDHAFNLWFVAASETESGLSAVLERIEAETGYTVYRMPKLNEYYVGLFLEA